MPRRRKAAFGVEGSCAKSIINRGWLNFVFGIDGDTNIGGSDVRERQGAERNRSYALRLKNLITEPDGAITMGPGGVFGDKLNVKGSVGRYVHSTTKQGGITPGGYPVQGEKKRTVAKIPNQGFSALRTEDLI